MPDDIDLTLYSIKRDEEEKVVQDQAAKLKMPYINLVSYPVAPEILGIIPEAMARKFHVVSYLRAGDMIRLATSQPENVELQHYLEELATVTKNKLTLSLCSETSLLYALALYKTLLPEMPEDTKVEVTQDKAAAFEAEIKNFQDLKEKITQVSTTDLLDLIFAGAMKNDASDVHIEPEEEIFRLRYRIDGVLQEVAKLPKSAYRLVVNRIKNLAKLKLDVTHPQDGRFAVTVLGEEMDIRVSSMPTSYGEAVVMRLLPKKKGFSKLENLGFNQHALDLINEAISKPQGMILNTGPTGSGKTTTLYAILEKINQPGRKIITLENPIEYRVEGVEQIQINSEDQTSFLDGLRGALRQDPDILMIGEIRDAESAKIALQAAMTGHLVLTTLHTNNAPSTLARLADMGIDPFLLAGSINLIIGQRLVRTVHKDCGGKGCEEDHNTGYKGRTGIIEVLVPTKEIEDLIYKKAPLRDYMDMAKKQGMKTMYEDGLEKVAQGLTTKEEVERVTKE